MPSDADEARKAIKAAGSNTWRWNNHEHRKAYAREYYAKNREKLLARKKANPPKDPVARAVYVKEWHKENREAVLEHKRRYREANREKIREDGRRYIRDESGEVKPEHKERARRNGAIRAASLETIAGRPRPEVCDACGGPPDKGISLHFDHCHTHGHFRGWLCRECNLALGNVRDDPNRLLKLVAYLKRTARNPVDQFAIPGI